MGELAGDSARSQVSRRRPGFGRMARSRIPRFDPATGTLCRPSVKLTALPDRLTVEEKTRLMRLADSSSLVNDFPFARAGVDCSVWLAGLLTAIQRPAIAGPCQPVRLQWEQGRHGQLDSWSILVGLIVWGLAIPTRSYPVSPIEAAGKIKLSLALSGIAAVHFDNLPEGGFYGSSELDSALTSSVVEGRILGRSQGRRARFPLRPCWFLTGNNISPGKDAFRRWVPFNPQDRSGKPHEAIGRPGKDLRHHVEQHRAELLLDALVILKTHISRGARHAGGTLQTGVPLRDRMPW